MLKDERCLVKRGILYFFFRGSFCFSANSNNQDDCLPEDIMAKALQLANMNAEASSEIPTFVCPYCAVRNKKVIQQTSTESAELY